MLETIKSILKKKPLVLCIHGFGHRRSNEYNNFKLWGSKEFEFITFDIFDVDDKLDTNSDEWIMRCENKLKELLKSNREVSIIGFSMGGVIATYLASKYKIKKLFLIAPAFEFINVKSVLNAITQMMNNQTSSLTMSKEQTACFMEVVAKCKDSIHLIICPTLMVHGDSDDVISVRSSIHNYSLIPHDQKRLIILHGGPHRLMLNPHTSNEVYQLFKLFMNNQIITNHLQLADDPYRKIENSN